MKGRQICTRNSSKPCRSVLDYICAFVQNTKCTLFPLGATMVAPVQGSCWTSKVCSVCLDFQQIICYLEEKRKHLTECQPQLQQPIPQLTWVTVVPIFFDNSQRSMKERCINFHISSPSRIFLWGFPKKRLWEWYILQEQHKTKHEIFSGRLTDLCQTKWGLTGRFESLSVCFSIHFGEVTIKDSSIASK